jgi:EAL domain-containing protein (putative c-di-GMP-specific phosphodiesterase class I)/GGDEF domain-containing protein
VRLLDLRRLSAELPGDTSRDVLAITAAGMSFPFISLLVPHFYLLRSVEPDTLLWWVMCTSICLLSWIVVAWRLRPIGKAAGAMRELVAAARLAPDTARPANELQSLLANIALVSSRFDALRDRLANQHPGTGFPTREPFLADVESQIDRGAGPTLLALVRLADFDRMAAFDRSAAERGLQAFGERLREAGRKTLSLAQVDRDTFAAWFRSTVLDEAVGELRAIAYVLGQEMQLADQTLAPEVVLGCAVYPDDASDAASLLACAFAALPKTGTPHASAPTFFSPSTVESARKTFQLEQDLRKAIGGKQLDLHYQPVIDLSKKRVAGAEALLRWRHPELGMVPPSDFIPILERSGLIEEVGLWALNTACREARTWRRGGLRDLTMAVNVSASQFSAANLAATVVRTLERHGLTPAELEIEVTETAAMSDSARTREILQQLHVLGVGVAIDDFGAGYSSLSYLKNLPFTKLKIDREFVVKVHERPDSRAICSALVALADGFGITLLAEGVEEREEVETLVRLGCSMFQGFFFAEPMPTDDFVAFVKAAAWFEDLDLPDEGRSPHRRRA